jgi:uncharacterized membrane protein YkvI
VGFVVCGCFDICGVFSNMCTCTYCVFILFLLCIIILICYLCKDQWNRVKSQVKLTTTKIIIIIIIITKNFVVISYRRFEINTRPIFKWTWQFSRVKYMNFLTFQCRSFGCPEISVRNYHCALNNNTEERRSYRPQHGA